VLRGMPPTLWLAAREHHDAMLRELALHLAGAGPRGDLDLAAADRARFLISDGVVGEVEHARREGRATAPLPQYHPGALPDVPDDFDLALDVSPEQVRDFAALQDALDEGERLAAAGRLLVHAGLPEIVAVRDWACEQVIAQLGGVPPAPWSGVDDDRFLDVDVSDLATEHGWDDSLVRQAAGGAVAVDDANRVISISRPLAEEIGWRPEDLVGRRVVAIVPPRFREAHVAGFSRHLSTGDARALGTALELPVLRADGSEVLCSFLIESHPTPTGRQVYVAWIAPLREDA
jgi:PAS domain S-box-containing protein